MNCSLCFRALFHATHNAAETSQPFTQLPGLLFPTMSTKCRPSKSLRRINSHLINRISNERLYAFEDAENMRACAHKIDPFHVLVGWNCWDPEYVMMWGTTDVWRTREGQQRGVNLMETTIRWTWKGIKCELALVQMYSIMVCVVFIGKKVLIVGQTNSLTWSNSSVAKYFLT